MDANPVFSKCFNLFNEFGVYEMNYLRALRKIFNLSAKYKLKKTFNSLIQRCGSSVFY